MTLSTVLFTNKKLFEMFIPFYKNSKIQVEVIFEPKINRIVLIPDQEKLSESKLDFNYIYNELKTILIKKDKNLLLYSKIHIQLNKKHALISPHNKMTPIKKYKIMNLNLENINTADYNQNQNFDFDLINKIKNENELITHLSFIQNISFKDSWGYSPNSQNDIRKKIKSNNNITNGIIFAFKSKKETLFGLSGLGDLMLTCNSSKSRNTNFGIKIANIKHNNFEKELDKNAITEGYFTAKAAIKIATENGIEMPILESVFNILYNGFDIEDEINKLMSRPLTIENIN